MQGNTLRRTVLGLSRRVQFVGKGRLMTLFGVGPGRVDLVPSDVQSVRCRHGITIATGNNRDVMFRELYFHGQYTEDVLEALRELLKPGDVFWDIGANYGYMSIFVDKFFNGAVRTIAFEPSPVVLPELRRNLALNNCRSVEIHEQCLSDREGTVKFYVSKDHSWNATLVQGYAQANGEDTVVEVRSSTIDQCVKTLPPPSMIKLDVEGAEPLVMAGGREFLSKNPVPIVAEYNLESIASSGLTPVQFLDLFRDLGYTVHRMRRPWVGQYRWKTLHPIAGIHELPALCDIVLLNDARKAKNDSH